METELEALLQPEFLAGFSDLSIPASHKELREPEHYLEFLTLSVAFNPQTQFPYPYTGIPPDIILEASDQTLFYVHRHRLQTRSHSGFGGLFTGDGVGCVTSSDSPIFYQVSETSLIINCLLHILYGTSYHISDPDLTLISQTFDALEKYGCSLRECVPPESEIFTNLVKQAADLRLNPLPIYTLAASRGFEQLAVACSFHVLRVPFSAIDEQTALVMGPIYLLRLGRLYENRKKALSKLLQKPLNPHEDTATCNVENRNSVMRAYGLIAGYLTWEAKPNIHEEWIKGYFMKLMGSVECSRCKERVNESVGNVLDGWTQVQKTI